MARGGRVAGSAEGAHETAHHRRQAREIVCSERVCIGQGGELIDGALAGVSLLKPSHEPGG